MLQPQEEESDSVIFLVVVLSALGLAFLLGVCVGLKLRRPVTRSVQCQSQLTYAHWREHPRFLLSGQYEGVWAW